MKAYVINLARSPERRAHMASEFRKTGMEHEFVEGVEGANLDLDDSSIIDPIWLGNSPFFPGVAGCAMSHLKVYEKIIEDGSEVGLVLEDDVILPPDIDAIAEAVAAHMVGSEVVLLQYFSYLSLLRGDACRLSRRGSLELPSSRVLAFPAEVADLGASGAYLITREACELTAKAVLPVRVPADDWAFFFHERALHGVRCVIPMPVRINPEFRTTIDHYSPGSVQTYLRKAATRVPLLSHALTRRRQRIMNLTTKVELIDRPSDQRHSGNLSGL